MKTVNRCEIVGFVGRDAEKRSDRAPVKFSIATGNDTRPDGGKNPLCFHNVTFWDRQPEALKIKKGDYVRVTGRLNYTKWTDKEGIERSGLEVVADQVKILPKDSQPQTQPKPRGTRPFTNVRGVDVDDHAIEF